MDSQNENKRLVLIGIRRKGEKGFKKQVDSEIASNQPVTDAESINIPLVPLSNSNQILNLLSE